ncbi:MAG: NUMOD4 domain-containing protein [Culicoidibacterales bacterium]
MCERWVEIKGYEGYYEISNTGKVKSLVFQSNVHNKKYKREKILKPKGKSYNPGLRVSLWKDGIQKDLLIARLVAFTFLNEDINNAKLTVNHKDGNRFNNNIENLELISLSDNIRHAFDTGLMDACCKKVTLVDLETGEKHEFRSLSRASAFLGRNKGYLSLQIKRGKREIENFSLIL